MIIDLAQLNAFFNEHDANSRGSTTEARTNSFKMGYLCAMAVKMGYTPDHLREVMEGAGGTRDALKRLHTWMEERVAQLPNT
jgi:hypothetical protein